MLKEKQKGGITLISLVITIVVLLILASVAISIAIDSNGIFGRARYAADTWNKSIESEETTINNALEVADEILGPVLPDGWNPNYVADVITEGTRTAPIPKGYTASKIVGEDKISDGLVIYEGETTVIGEKDGEEHKVAMKDRNQYVWIPVDNINSMVMCQNHPNEKLDAETALCKQCGESTPLVGKLYTNIQSDSTEPQLTFDPDSGLREPAVIIGNSGDEYDGKLAGNFGLGTAEVFLAHLKEEFSNMAKSVAKYKGFYISRYEIQAGAASKQEANVLHAGLNSANTWYGLYTTIKDSTNPESTVPQMIWGSQYDQVMMFVDGKNGYDVQTAVEDRHTNKSAKSGQNDNDIACNIYDLEGNYMEWTSEAGDSGRRILRGRVLQRRWFRIDSWQQRLSTDACHRHVVSCHTLCSDVMLVAIHQQKSIIIKNNLTKPSYMI